MNCINNNGERLTKEKWNELKTTQFVTQNLKENGNVVVKD